VIVQRAEIDAEVPEIVEAAVDLAFNGRVAVAVLVAQRLIGRKQWGGKGAND
jgi:hypothetical protein